MIDVILAEKMSNDPDDAPWTYYVGRFREETLQAAGIVDLVDAGSLTGPPPAGLEFLYRLCTIYPRSTVNLVPI